MIRRDVQLYYLEGETAYQFAINPKAVELLESEEYEIALIALSDGEGSFKYIFVDEFLWEEYHQDDAEESQKKRGVRILNPRETLKAIFMKLSKYNTIYQIRNHGEPYGDIIGIAANKKQAILTQYDEYLEVSGTSTDMVTVFTVKPLETLQKHQKFLVICRRLDNAEKFVQRLREQKDLFGGW